MGLESGTYINELVASNPAGSDGKNAGDDHIRLIKSTLLATFANFTGAEVAARESDLVQCSFGVGSDPTVSDDNTAGYAIGSVWVNTSSGDVFICAAASTGAANWIQLDNDAVQAFPSGTVMLFYQNSAPTGWTKQTSSSYNDKAVITTTGNASIYTSGTAASTFFSSSARSTSTHAGHTHGDTFSIAAYNSTSIGASGGSMWIIFNGSHTHTLNGSVSSGGSHAHTLDTRVNYLGFIVASAN